MPQGLGVQPGFVSLCCHRSGRAVPKSPPTGPQPASSQQKTASTIDMTPRALHPPNKAHHHGGKRLCLARIDKMATIWPGAHRCLLPLMQNAEPLLRSAGTPRLSAVILPSKDGSPPGESSSDRSVSPPGKKQRASLALAKTRSPLARHDREENTRRRFRSCIVFRHHPLNTQTRTVLPCTVHAHSRESYLRRLVSLWRLKHLDDPWITSTSRHRSTTSASIDLASVSDALRTIGHVGRPWYRSEPSAYVWNSRSVILSASRIDAISGARS